MRDALAWAAQINESIDLFGDRLEIQFASHHWPIWGREAAIEYLEKQRDLYKFIHDQTLRLANKGYNKEEIAERVTLPDSLSKEFFNRDYYGTVHHNSRAVYVKYLGFSMAIQPTCISYHQQNKPFATSIIWAVLTQS